MEPVAEPLTAVTNGLIANTSAALTVTDVIVSQLAKPVVVIVAFRLVKVVVPLYVPLTEIPSTAGVIV